ncbi:AAA family ATPase [Niallia alba]|uniref:AAA family ATPase n=1 Tax=Niallia alba TaxID=2729105 RepID=UPI002E1AA9C4|nr:AAA family ATPase [Niallia alba]
MAKFRKPQARKQGLKILAYGENGSGKSWFDLSFPDNAIIDSESKIGVNENNPLFRDKIAAIADTSNYYDAVELMEEVIKNPKSYKTFTIDSYTKIYSAIQVACMEVEEERARKKGGNIDDSTLSMRSHGKVKLNVLRFEDYIAQASSKGINVIAVAHKVDVKQKSGENWIKVGEKPDLKANAEHTFDVVLRFYKEKDIVTGEYKYMAEVEKDTTNTYKLGQKLENVTYDHFKEYIEKNEKEEIVNTHYDKTINDNVNVMKKEQEDHETIVKEFKTLYSELVKQDESNKSKVASLMKAKGVEKYNDTSLTPQLIEVIQEMKKL